MANKPHDYRALAEKRGEPYGIPDPNRKDQKHLRPKGAGSEETLKGPTAEDLRPTATTAATTATGGGGAGAAEGGAGGAEGKKKTETKK